MAKTVNPTKHLSLLQTNTTADWYCKSAQHWLQVCRDYDMSRGLMKKAELGGSYDTPFEQAFANLAHTYIRDKSPKLLNYEVGFQLVMKNDKNTKAFGVFAFKIADQWCYIPVFFLNGDIKGYELIYLKNQDLFIPNKERWIDMLLGQKPFIIGTDVTKNLSDLGHAAPDLMRMTRSPYKWASVHPRTADWFDDFLPKLAQWVTAKHAKSSNTKFLDGLCQAKTAGIAFLKEIADQYPNIYRQLEEAYGKDSLKKVAQTIHVSIIRNNTTSILTGLNDGRSTIRNNAASLVKKADFLDDANNRGYVRVVLREDLANLGKATTFESEDDLTKVITRGFVVQDRRPSAAVSRVFRESSSLSLFNPEETNVYEVLTGHNTFKKCLVIMHPLGSRVRGGCLVVDLETKDCCHTDVRSVYCRSRLDKTGFLNWLNSLPVADRIPEECRGPRLDRPDSSKGQEQARKCCVLVGNSGHGTLPFWYCSSYSDGSGRFYEVEFACGCLFSFKAPKTKTWHYLGWVDTDYMNVDQNVDTIKTVRLLNRATSRPKIVNEELHVPADFRQIIVNNPETNDSGKLILGDPLELQLSLYNNTTPLEVSVETGHVVLNKTSADVPRAVKALVMDYGLTEKAALAIIDEAAKNPGIKQRYLVKKAESPFLNKVESLAPPIPDEVMTQGDEMATGVPSKGPDERLIRVDALVPDFSTAFEKHRPSSFDHQTMSKIWKAMQTGQKEIFDTSMLATLLSAIRDDSMIDRYFSDLMRGLDRKGRIYFQLLWHNEEFEKRYGKTDLAALEDALRNAFEADGDLILALKQKSAKPVIGEPSRIDLDALT